MTSVQGGTLRSRTFKYHAIGYRHLNRNKTNRNLAKKRGLLLTSMADKKKARRLFPYFRRKKYTKM